MCSPHRQSVFENTRIKLQRESETSGRRRRRRRRFLMCRSLNRKNLLRAKKGLR